MLKLSIAEIIAKIEHEETFEATDVAESFALKIGDYVPYICAAIHNGSNLRRELSAKIALNATERYYEEDPFTADFVASLPIVIQGLDSRYEYDLNRRPEIAVYDVAWGKQVWKAPLTEGEKAESLAKHTAFYQVIEALVRKIERKFKACVVYDIHSYNYKRHEEETPVFNIGTEVVNHKKFEIFIAHWQKQLSKIQLPDMLTTVAENQVFFGRGYFLEFITKRFKNTLVLATEVKKIYMDELSGDSYPKMIEALNQGFKKAILNDAIHFTGKMTNLRLTTRYDLLSSELDKDIIRVDEAIYRLAKDIEILTYVNPINIELEKKHFFQTKFKKNPAFRYKHIAVDPFELKRKLYRIPVEEIDDINIQNMYKDVINSYADKVDMLAALGTDKFLINSIRYFGIPTEGEQRIADFILYSPDRTDEDDTENITPEQAHHLFAQSATDYGFKFKIEISSSLTSKALVSNSRQALILKKGAFFSKRSVQALIHHEIGVHMVTTINARLQPIHLFNLGLPLNTKTQEGLAILAEYFSGNLTTNRLKELALRVITVQMILRGYDFKEAFIRLIEEYKVPPEKAFYLTTRIYRGGGFTKDHLYLSGFRELLQFYESRKSLDCLLIGKTSLPYYDIIHEMIAREMIQAPKFRTIAYENPQTDDPILNYLVQGIR
jgi:uncharacterized protein (TIGR02421 family)